MLKRVFLHPQKAEGTRKSQDFLEVIGETGAQAARPQSAGQKYVLSTISNVWDFSLSYPQAVILRPQSGM